MRGKVFVDANRFLEKELKRHPGAQASFRRTLSMKLKNVNALITGGSQGLGKVIAEHFLREGANVCICARNEKELSATRDELANEISVAKRSWQDLRRFQRIAGQRTGRLRVAANLVRFQALVLNAGIYGPMGPTESVDLDEWRRAMDINLFGVLLPCRALIPHFKKAGGGKIIVIERRRRDQSLAQYQFLRRFKGGGGAAGGNVGGGIKAVSRGCERDCARRVGNAFGGSGAGGWAGKSRRGFFREKQEMEGKRRGAARSGRAPGRLSWPARKATASPANSSARNGTRGKNCMNSKMIWRGTFMPAPHCARGPGQNMG